MVSFSPRLLNGDENPLLFAPLFIEAVSSGFSNEKAFFSHFSGTSFRDERFPVAKIRGSRSISLP
jgi:hypothetical protein